MGEKVIAKMGYFTIFFDDEKNKYITDNGKTITLRGLNKVVPNTNRELKEFKTIDEAKKYVKKKLEKSKKRKAKILKKLPKMVYLILMKEESTGNLFVKVGITSKKFVSRRFSKEYGYDGYEIQEILRKVKTPNAEKYEEKIKNEIKKRSIPKYRPLLEGFSGYSECFNILNLQEIIEIYDKIVKLND